MARNYKRDRKGRFAKVAGGVSARRGKKKAARKKLKYTKARNKTGYKNRVRGSVKARKNELRANRAVRAKNVSGGATKLAAGVVLNSEHMTSAGSRQLRQGIKGNVGRVKSTRAMAKGLKKSQNRAAKKQYRKDIGRTGAKRAARAGVIAASTVGLAYAANRNGNVKAFRSNFAGESSVGVSVSSKRLGVHGGLIGNMRGGTIYGNAGKRRGAKSFGN